MGFISTFARVGRRFREAERRDDPGPLDVSALLGTAGLETRSDPLPVEGRVYRMAWGPVAANTPAGVAVTPGSALTVAAYFACLNRISSDVGSHPFRVMRKVAGKGRVEVPDHPLTRLGWVPLPTNGSSDLDAIEASSTRTKCLPSYVSHALGWGGGFLRVRFGDDGFPEALQLLDPSATEVTHRAADGTLYYRTGGETFRAGEVLHLAGLGYDGLRGYSIARYARETLGLAKAQEVYGGRFFGTGGSVKGVLTTDQKLDENAVGNLRSSWNDLHEGPFNSQRIAVLEQGLKYQGISIPPEDAQFLQSRQYQLVEVARWFGLPPHKIGDYSQMQLASAGVEAANLDYLTSVILTWIAKVEDEWNGKLLSDEERAAGLAIEFDVSWLLRADSRTRAEYNRESLAWGVNSRNEVRAREGYNPIDGGDEVLVPGNMVPLKQMLAGQAALTMTSER